jgi:transketolase
MATRKASGKVLTALHAALPELIGGSADLAGSNNTYVPGHPAFSASQPDGRNLHFGVREHAMGAVQNGMALSGMLRPYGGTFLIFSDYMRHSIRLAALMGLPTLYVLTHDSIFLGEDGPTHQPISQLISMRSIPGLITFRPADANETAAAWREAIRNQKGPTVLSLTRQGLPVQKATARLAEEGVARGAYVLADPEGEEPQAILIASGSEVSLAMQARQALTAEGIHSRVVSMPCWSLFDAQDQAYRDSVLPPGLTRRLAIEAASPLGWHRYAGSEGDVLAIDGFGASAPAKDLAEEFGFTVENVVRRVRALF